MKDGATAIRLIAAMLEVGKPIPWDLYNRAGKLVFRRGFVVRKAANIERLSGMELYIGAAAGEDRDTAAGPTGEAGAAALRAHSQVGPLRTVDQLADRISDCFSGLCLGQASDGGELQQIVGAIRALFSRSPDTCIAAVHFNRERSYQSLHALYSAFLALRLAAELGYGDGRSGALTGAALTANLGMFEFHDDWASQAGALDEAQQQIRLRHPRLSVERLRASGISDPVWLAAVLHHHERCDGGGYPEGLEEAAIPEEALVLGLIDRYLACVLPRQGRTAMFPGEALKRLYGDAAIYGAARVEHFISAIGIYPPGVAVVLANGEVAVVTRRGEDDAAHPVVVGVRQPGGGYLDPQPLRQTREPPYRIVRPYRPSKGEVVPALLVKAWR